MKSYLSKFVNRETEIEFLKIIGDYCSCYKRTTQHRYYQKFISNCVHHYRLRFNVTKRRKLGTIYVEEIKTCEDHSTVVKRKYLRSFKWEVVDDPTLACLRHELFNIKQILESRGINTKYIHKQLEVHVPIHDIKLVER